MNFISPFKYLNLQVLYFFLLKFVAFHFLWSWTVCFVGIWSLPGSTKVWRTIETSTLRTTNFTILRKNFVHILQQGRQKFRNPLPLKWLRNKMIRGKKWNESEETEKKRMIFVIMSFLGFMALWKDCRGGNYVLLVSRF